MSPTRVVSLMRAATCAAYAATCTANAATCAACADPHCRPSCLILSVIMHRPQGKEHRALLQVPLDQGVQALREPHKKMRRRPSRARRELRPQPRGPGAGIVPAGGARWGCGARAGRRRHDDRRRRRWLAAEVRSARRRRAARR